jgi:hypothetical protein
LVRLYLWARRSWTRVVRAAHAIFDGFWLGALGRRSLHRIDELCYSGWGEYESDSYNRSGLRQWEREAIVGHFPSACRIILIGAGGGREVLALSELGYLVDAYECHPDLVRAANRLLDEVGLAVTVRPLERDKAPLAAEPSDGAVVGWGAYMLIRGRDRRIAFLEGLRTKLPPGGPILLSFYDRKPSDRRFHASAAIGNVVRLVAANERVEVGDGLAPNFVHYFTEDEIRTELSAAGFELVSFDAGEYGHAVGRAR